MMKKCFLAVVLCGVLGIGCERTTYTITMKPQKDVIKREIHTSASFPDDITQRLAKQYPPATQPYRGGKRFVGTFTGQLPKDIGQAGWYLYYDTSMGQSYVYSERFGKNDDMVTRMTGQFQAIDKLVDHLIGWFTMELGNDPNFEQFRQFLDVNLRRDVKNMLLYVFPYILAESCRKENDETHYQELYLRAFQYLAERDYFDTKDLPKVLNLGSSFNLFPIAQYLVARKLGYDTTREFPKSLAFLTDEKTAEESMKRYLATTPKYKKLLQEWEEEKKSNPNASQPDPFDAMKPIATDLIQIELDLFNSIPHLDIKLVCSTQPLATNGTWQEKTKTVTWSKSLSEESIGLPMYAYALWAVPNEEFQKAHFGKVVLTGEKLASYCLWRKSLSDRQGQKWDAFLDNLKPGENLEKKVKDAGLISETATQPSDAIQVSVMMADWAEAIKEALKKVSTTQATQPGR